MSFVEATGQVKMKDPDIGDLRRQLDEGSYQVDPEAIAEAVILWHTRPEMLLKGGNSGLSRPRTPR